MILFRVPPAAVTAAEQQDNEMCLGMLLVTRP